MDPNFALMAHVPEDIQLLRQIRDLLLLIAEPQIAARDKKLREALVEIVGAGKKARDAVLLMNGLHTQTEISRRAGIDPGQLSRLVGRLKAADLLNKEGETLSLSISIP